MTSSRIAYLVLVGLLTLVPRVASAGAHNDPPPPPPKRPPRVLNVNGMPGAAEQHAESQANPVVKIRVVRTTVTMSPGGRHSRSVEHETSWTRTGGRFVKEPPTEPKVTETPGYQSYAGEKNTHSWAWVHRTREQRMPSRTGLGAVERGWRSVAVPGGVGGKRRIKLTP
jgi:hypothetical protein